MKSEIKEFRERFWRMVKEAEEVVIAGHIGPDDDSVASTLAVYWLLKEKFPKKKVRMICLGKKTGEWEYFENFNKVEFVEELADFLVDLVPEKALVAPTTPGRTSVVEPLLVMLDGSGFDRFTKEPGELKKLALKTVCIDHHRGRPDEFDLLFVSPSLSSTAEGVYRLLVEPRKELPKRLAEIFMLGVLSDTGDFAFLNKETAGVLEIVRELIETGGVEIQELMSKYRQIPKRALWLVGEMISGTKYFESIGKWPPFQVAILKKELVLENNLSDEEVSKASHLYMNRFLRSVKGYGWGFTITPREDRSCRLSFRSLPGVVNVRRLAENFGGGGHDLASGGRLETNGPEEALETILKWMEGNKPV